MSFTPATAKALAGLGLDPTVIERLVQVALTEDLGSGVDVTSLATVPFDLEGVADFTARASGVVAGLPVVRAVMEVVTDDSVVITQHVQDGDAVSAGDVLLTARALVRALLTAERTALNILCHLSGIAKGFTQSAVSPTNNCAVAVARTPCCVRPTICPKNIGSGLPPGR